MVSMCGIAAQSINSQDITHRVVQTDPPDKLTITVGSQNSDISPIDQYENASISFNNVQFSWTVAAGAGGLHWPSACHIMDDSFAYILASVFSLRMRSAKHCKILLHALKTGLARERGAGKIAPSPRR